MYFRRIGGRSAAHANMLNTPLRLHVLRDGAESTVPSSTVPDVTAAPTYVYSRIFAFLSPRHPPHDLFPPLHLVSNYTFYSGTPYLHRHPTPTSDSRSYPRLTYPDIFFRLSITILTFLEAVEPYLQRHPYINITFGFLSSPYLPQHFFTTLYHHFNFFQAVEPNLQRHPYTILTFGFHSFPYLPQHFFPTLYHHFNFS